MANPEEFKDDFIKKIVTIGTREMPNSDFENQMMLKIQASADYKLDVYTKLKLSLRFFLAGLILGICLMLGLYLKPGLLSFDTQYLAIFSLFIIGIISILSIDNYIRMIKIFVSKE